MAEHRRPSILRRRADYCRSLLADARVIPLAATDSAGPPGRVADLSFHAVGLAPRRNLPVSNTVTGAPE